MRALWACAAVLMVAMPGTGMAQTWKARAELIESKSAEGCPRDLSVYTLSLDGGSLSGADVDGKMFTVAVPATKVIKEDYRSPSGSRLEISGNVGTRHLEIYSNLRGCWWRLVPERG
jgi:hypothetical protein